MIVQRLFMSFLISLIVHLGVLSLMSDGHVFDFWKPVAMATVVTVDLQRGSDSSHEAGRGRDQGAEKAGVEPKGNERDGQFAGERKDSFLNTEPLGVPGSPAPELLSGSGLVHADAERKAVFASSGLSEMPQGAHSSGRAGGRRNLRLQPPLHKGDEFLAAAREKLTYRILLLGIPVGEAVLEAVGTEDGITITSRVKSNAAISSVYPVDDFAESRLVCGNYLVTTIRQHEGAYTRTAGFTLMLREKKVFSGERLRDRFVTEALPRDDVLDLMSGFYFARNQPMEVGRTMLLHLYDGDQYAPTEVEILRSERVHVAGLGDVETLVVHPRLTTPGFFRRTGDITVWLTADAYKVPVRMETSIRLGKVTAELVSAEVER